MSEIVEQARKVIELRGDTYSSYEVIGLLGQLAAEIERLHAENTRLQGIIEFMTAANREAGIG